MEKLSFKDLSQLEAEGFSVRTAHSLVDVIEEAKKYIPAVEVKFFESEEKFGFYYDREEYVTPLRGL